MNNDNLKSLEQQLDELIYHCRLLEQENKALRSQEDNWKKERIKLVEKNEIARNRVESMIHRLKAFELRA